MPEIYFFKVPNATAGFDGEGTHVTLQYPPAAEREPVEGRLPPAEEFGIGVFNALLSGSQARIGTEQHPLRPPSGGVIDVFSDGAVLTHRRDGFAPTHPLQFSTACGFPSREEQFYNVQLLISREGAEEHLLFDREGFVLLPDDLGAVVSHQLALRLGLKERQFRVLPVRYSLDDGSFGPDILDIKDHNGELISRERGFINLAWDSAATLNFLRVRRWPISSEEVEAVDGEGMERSDGAYQHFNREAFVFRRDELEKLSYGSRMNEPRVYRLQNGRPARQAQEPADAPYIFWQDEALDRMLRGLGIWQGGVNWLQRQKAVEEASLTARQRGDYVSYAAGTGFVPCEPAAKRAVPAIHRYIRV